MEHSHNTQGDHFSTLSDGDEFGLTETDAARKDETRCVAAAVRGCEFVGGASPIQRRVMQGGPRSRDPASKDVSLSDVGMTSRLT
jgi:hypothetical protein